MEASVFRLVHHTHAAAAQLLDDAIVRDDLPDHSVWPIMQKLRALRGHIMRQNSASQCIAHTAPQINRSNRDSGVPATIGLPGPV